MLARHCVELRRDEPPGLGQQCRQVVIDEAMRCTVETPGRNPSELSGIKPALLGKYMIMELLLYEQNSALQGLQYMTAKHGEVAYG